MGMSKDTDVTFVNVPLDADAYCINADLTDYEMRRLRLAWAKMNEGLDKPKMLIVLPQEKTLKKAPSSVLYKWMEACAGILKDRGEEVPGHIWHEEKPLEVGSLVIVRTDASNRPRLIKEVRKEEDGSYTYDVDIWGRCDRHQLLAVQRVVVGGEDVYTPPMAVQAGVEV